MSELPQVFDPKAILDHTVQLVDSLAEWNFGDVHPINDRQRVPFEASAYGSQSRFQEIPDGPQLGSPSSLGKPMSIALNVPERPGWL
jgi:hypothetical protein